MITYDREGALLREVQIMAAAGWRLHRRWPDGADFTSGGSGSGISTSAHLILIILTLGLWLPVMIVVELASSGGARYCRLTFTPEGQARYEPMKRPR